MNESLSLRNILSYRVTWSQSFSNVLLFETGNEISHFFVRVPMTRFCYEKEGMRTAPLQEPTSRGCHSEGRWRCSPQQDIRESCGG